jgi:hypothetical protein
MAARTEVNRAELMALLARLNSSLDGGAPPRPPAGSPTPEEALALYFVAARLVELQLRLLENDEGPVELARQLAITRDVLEGTRTVLRAALDAVGMSGQLDGEVPATPVLRVVHGGRSHLRNLSSDVGR